MNNQHFTVTKAAGDSDRPHKSNELKEIIGQEREGWISIYKRFNKTISPDQDIKIYSVQDGDNKPIVKIIYGTSAKYLKRKAIDNSEALNPLLLSIMSLCGVRGSNVDTITDGKFQYALENDEGRNPYTEGDLGELTLDTDERKRLELFKVFFGIWDLSFDEHGYPDKNLAVKKVQSGNRHRVTTIDLLTLPNIRIYKDDLIDFVSNENTKDAFHKVAFWMNQNFSKINELLDLYERNIISDKNRKTYNEWKKHFFELKNFLEANGIDGTKYVKQRAEKGNLTSLQNYNCIHQFIKKDQIDSVEVKMNTNLLPQFKQYVHDKNSWNNIASTRTNRSSNSII